MLITSPFISSLLLTLNKEHPITPPHELVQKWANETDYDERSWLYEIHIANRAAAWGADQQLLACGKYLEKCAAWEEEDVTEMYNYLRSKPPSLKEQALQELDLLTADATTHGLGFDASAIRRALESLPD